MADNHVDAAIILHTDPHHSEYIAPHWQGRQWLSGFSGSAGHLLVTADDAFLWTDSRYFLQAAEQLKESGVKLMKMGLPETPSMNEFLATTLHPGQRVGVDGMLMSRREAVELAKALTPAGIELDTAFDPLATIWLNRPSLSTSPIILHDTALAGATATEKLNDLRDHINTKHADGMLVSALDEIAWVLNIRSRDVKCNPVVTSYLFIPREGEATLFVNLDKITPEVAEYFASIGVSTLPYNDVKKFLGETTTNTILADPATVATTLLDIMGDKAVAATSPIVLAKAIKNPVQNEGMRAAHIRDGVALVKANMEIEQRLAAGDHLTEMTVAEILRRHRSEREMFFDESFDPIIGFGSNGAIVHYSPSEESAATITPDNLLLMDSGAQYLDGTTDITRTISLGNTTPEQRHRFTLVLKGHIDVAMALFPAGTCGTQLDILARQAMWREGLNYLHGTGHGVGHFLNVHEGPHQLRMNYVPTPLQAGMNVTDEPGLYFEGQYGIRCENVLLVQHAETPTGVDFLCFEPLTMFPFDRRLIDTTMLSPEEIDWLDQYHARVLRTLSPLLDTPAERQWLALATSPLKK